MSKVSWPVAWAAAGAVAAALLGANLVAPPVLAGSAPELRAARAMTTVSPTPSPSPGADLTPPTAPEDLRACPPPPPPSGSFQGVVGLCWTASSDDTAVTEYKVIMLKGDNFFEVASTSRTTAVVPGLVDGRTYTFYVVAKDAAGNTSRPSALLSTPAISGANVTPTPPTGDTTPPSRPAGLQPNCLPDFKGTSLCWTASTDDVGVTGYNVFRRTGTGWMRVGMPIGTHFTEGPLVTGQSYVYFIVAKDAAGNLSLPSDLVTATASGGYPSYSPPPVTCEIEYTAWSWTGGFSASVKITNVGQAPINDWTLRFVLPDAGQQVGTGWSAAWSQSGKDVTAAAMPWNSVIQGGGSVQIGFNGTLTGANPDPTGFRLNGGSCVRR
ncbi:cellulose binding domain-containing protein [Microbispora sp. H11081]|uniref:cellulose binding domain-containing protein n=1 Tax=Microbispora sp. H11081 TaxID=2729107 RepID=UPI001475CEE8|nr:cellulose binding domain-containing protein [Microbispora sp. H11081]